MTFCCNSLLCSFMVMSSWVTWQKRYETSNKNLINILITFPYISFKFQHHNRHSVCVGPQWLKDTMIFQLQDSVLVLSLNFKYGNMVWLNWLQDSVIYMCSRQITNAKLLKAKRTNAIKIKAFDVSLNFYYITTLFTNLIQLVYKRNQYRKREYSGS